MLMLQVGVLYTMLTTVLFVFPPGLPVTGNSMNYCIVAFAIIIIISAVQWIVDGRKNYTGPQLDVGATSNGEVEGLSVTGSHNSGPSNNGTGLEKKKSVSA